VRSRRWLAALAVVVGVMAIAAVVVWSQLPGIGAGGLLHPARRPMTAAAPPTCAESTFDGAGVTLRGWRCRAPDDHPRGTIVCGSSTCGVGSLMIQVALPVSVAGPPDFVAGVSHGF
jgi:hypothetical protein